MNGVAVSARVCSAICVLGFPFIAASQTLPNFSALVQKHAPAVVNISTTQKVERRSWPRRFDNSDTPETRPFNDFFERYFDEGSPDYFESTSLGSGFFISSDGYILTCAHVVDGASEITVRLLDRREFGARLIGLDRRGDIALLKIDAMDLPSVQVGDTRNLSVGEWVLAIGSPFGFDSSATSGIVSAKGRNLPKENYIPFIQTDVAINPGNSGGPLFNLSGKVIGVNSQIYSRTGGFMGLSFAIPIDAAMRVAKRLKSGTPVTRGWLGVTLQEVSSNLAAAYGLDRPAGALVSDILPGGPAAKSDLRTGDIILVYQEEAVERSSDLPPRVGFTAPGTRAALEIVRRGHGRLIVVVTVGALKESTTTVTPHTARVTAVGDRYGLVLQTINEAQRRQLEIDDGAYVADAGVGVAWEAGIRTGDVILEVDGKAVHGAIGFARLAAQAPRHAPIVLRIRRGAIIRYIALKRSP